MPPPLSAHPKRLGGYELVKEVGRGAMGVVYEARQLDLDRTVAVKVVLAGGLASHDELRRFEVEARAASRLHHPGIVPIHDIGEEDGFHYLVMDLITGPSLSERLLRGPLDPIDAAEKTRYIAEAIEFAHAHGVIHRDIKPANILLDGEGHPVITDFGLARTMDDESSLTISGAPIGTPAYMSPEQAEGQAHRIGPRTDVHALGAVLYALLTGRPPFSSKTAIATVQMVRETPPIPPHVLDPSIPRDLETIALKALQKDPLRRYRTAGAMANDLRRWADGVPIAARPVGRIERLLLAARRRPLVAALLAGLVLVSIVGAIAVTTQWLRTVEALDEARQNRERTTLTQIEALWGVDPRGFLASVDALPLDDPLVGDAVGAASAETGPADIRRRFRARLVGLLRAPDELERFDVHELVEAPDPHERAIAIEVVRRTLEAADSATTRPFLDSVARLVANQSTTADRRAAALLLGFAFGIGEPESAPDLEVLATAIARQDSYYVDAFLGALKAPPPALVGELERFAHRGTTAERERVTSLLCRLHSDSPERLVPLVGSLDPGQLDILRRTFAAGAEAPQSALYDIIDAPPTANSSLAPAIISSEAVAIEESAGLLDNRGAFVLAATDATIASLLDSMSERGYRPIKLRPRVVGDALYWAAVWTRDEEQSDWTIGDDRDDVDRAVDDRGDGLVVIDAASATIGARRRIAVLWGPKRSNVHEVAAIIARRLAEVGPLEAPLGARNFQLVSFHADRPGTPESVVSLLYELGDRQSVHLHNNYRVLDEDITDLVAGCEPFEIDLLDIEGGVPTVTSIWRPASDAQSRVLATPTLSEHVEEADRMIRDGFSMIAVSVHESGSRSGAASIWRRPTPSAPQIIAQDRRAAEAAVVLAGLGDPAPVLSLLGDASRPDARSFATLILSATMTPADPLVAALATADATTAKGVLRALAGYDASTLDHELRQTLEQEARRLAQSDEPGVRACARYLLEKFGIDVPARDGIEGHAFVTIDSQRPFLMGSRGTDALATSWEEPHWRVIDRTYALGDREVTFGQYERFLADRPDFDQGVRSDPALPAQRLSWFHAVAYCRWLSEKADLREHEMCYPQLDEIQAASRGGTPNQLTIPANMLERPGFRLPTEAEWEYACRSGSDAPRWFGHNPELIDAFVVGRASRTETAPAGRVPPDDNGLFDMLGNVFEWCHSPRATFSLGQGLVRDRLDMGGDADLWLIRGGSYDMPAMRLRSAARLGSPPGGSGTGVGFRIARTL